MPAIAPNWNADTIVHGGDLVDIPNPHVRFYRDSRRKLPVRVSIGVFYGIGVHFHVTIRSDADPVWNAESECWTHPWDDLKRFRGDHVSSKFNTRKAAEEFVRLTLADRFPKKDHTYFEDFTRARWLYREGD